MTLTGTLSVLATLDGIGSLTATQSAVLSVAATLQADGKLDCALSLVLSIAGDVTGSASSDVAANLLTALTVAPVIGAEGTLSATVQTKHRCWLLLT